MDDTGELRLSLFTRLLSLLPPGRCVDLGAGHGKFSQLAAAHGWDVTAVDARSERFPELPGVEFINQDVRFTDLDGYDAIVCLGLFYHLTIEDQVDLLCRTSGTPIVLDTHIASGEHPTLAHTLSAPVTVDGYDGVWYDEGPVEDPLASWGNERSFWHTEASLMRLLHSQGYDVVLAADPWVTPDRRFYLALPIGFVPATASGRGQLAALTRSVRRRVRSLVHR